MDSTENSDDPPTAPSVWACLEQRRTIRSFQNIPIPAAHLERLVRAAQRAATGCSFQTYSFVALTERHRRALLAERLRDVGSGSLPEAPVWLIGCVDLHRYFALLAAAGVKPDLARQTSPSRVVFAIHDLGLAVANLVTAAEALGYGSMLHGCVMYRPAEVAAFLGLPRGVMAIEVIALGVPAEAPPLRPRWPLRSVLHQDHYQLTSNEQAAAYLADASQAYTAEAYFQRYTRDADYQDHIVSKTQRTDAAGERDRRIRAYLEQNDLSL